MPGLLDPSTLYPDFLDPTGSGIFDSPEYRRARVFDTLGGIGAALLAAGSRPGADFGSSLAAGLAGGVQAGRGAEDRFLRRAMVGSQVAKNRQELANEKAWRDMFKTPIAAAGAAPTDMAAPAPVAQSDIDLPKARAAIKGNESGGRYDAIGPDTGRGRAYGAYQVMDFNIPTWTQEVLGRAYTPQEFLADEKAQDAVFDAKFGGYWKQYGNPQDAASVWFSGKPVQQAGNAKDILGTTVPAYLAKFNRGMTGGAAPPTMEAATLSPNPVAPAVAQGGGDASGNPVQLAQYTPGQAPQPAFRPQTMQEVVQTIPPGVRQMIGAMGRKEGMGVLMKYADPGSEAVLDTQTNQIVFIPKTMVGRDSRYAPAKVAELDIQRRQLANSERKTDIDERNAPVGVDNSGRPTVNQQVIDAEAAKAGAKVGPEVTTELAKDAIKRSNDWQSAGLKAQSNIGRLGALQTMLDQITTGKFAGGVNEIKAAAKAAGFDLEAMGVTDKVGVTQAAQALTNLLALENRDPSGGAGMPGAMSDADRQFLQQAGPSITKDPAGNKILIEIKKGDLQRQIDIAKFASEYKRSKAFKDDPAGLDDYVAEKIAGKNYYDPSLLQSQKKATDDYLTTLPTPPAGAVRRYNPQTGKIE